MKYSHNYTKLDYPYYTTIRRYSKGKVGDIVIEKYPKGQHKARIIEVQRKSLDNIPTHVIEFDTDTNSRGMAYELIQSFYKKPIDFKNEKFYIYTLIKEGTH